MGSLVGLLGWWLEPFPGGAWAGETVTELGPPGCCSQVGLGGDTWGILAGWTGWSKES